LLKIAKTAMTGKGAENSKEFLSRLCVDGVVALKNQEDLGKHLIKIASIPGENIEDSILFNGVVLENDFTSSSSPITQKGSKVILLNTPLEIKESEIDAKIQITNPSQIKEFIEAQDSILKEMAIKLSKKGINVVFCQKGIDDLVSHYLSELGISSIRRVPYSDMIRLSKSTGAKIVSNVDELRDADIGLAQTIEKKTIYNESYIFLKGTKQNSQTIIIRGANTQVSDEIIRALDDALGDLITLIKDKRAVVGAGAFELALYSILTQEAKSYPANEQIFINLFAEAILSIPKTLAENAGFDFEHFKRKFDSLSKIDETNTIEFSKKKNTEFLNLKELYGIGVYNGQLIKPFELGIIEPYMVKYRAILSASELAIAILRIDDVIVAKPKESSPFL
jgi:chaperonin GroEL (HSP60 family)